MRQINAVTTLRALRGEENLPLSRIRRLTGLSRSTLDGVLDDLIARGQVEEIPADAAARQIGRPARSFR